MKNSIFNAVGKMRYLALLVVLILTCGNVWGQVASATATDGNSYVVAVYYNSKYYALPHTTGVGQKTGEEVTVNGSGYVTSNNPPLWELEEGSTAGQFYLKYSSGNNTYYLYKNGTGNSNYNLNISTDNYNYWEFTAGTGANAGKYQVIAVNRGTNHTRFTGNGGSTFQCRGTSGYDIILLEVLPPCANSVTLSKGSETNGTFTISPTGSQASCSGVAVTVTPTPADGTYYVSAVSASTGETGTDNGNGTWTVNIAANTTGTSTINVTFTKKTLYTVTWYKEGAPITGLAPGLTSVYSGDKVTGVPSDPVSTCSGTFVGWAQSNDGVVDKNPTNSYTTVPTTFTDVAGSPAITGNTSFYAVFKKRKED